MTMNTMLTRRTLLAGLAAATAKPATAATPAATPTDTLRIGTAAPVTTLDPHLQSNAPNNALASHIFDALVTNDDQLRSRPGLVQSWRTLDDTHWEFTLRPGIRFTDGAPFTAADAAASLQRATDLPSTASFRTYTRTIKHIDASDPAILRIETHAPDPMLPNSLSRIRIIRAAFAAAPSPEFDAGRAAIGTGPFTLREYVPGSHIALARNDGWWGPKPEWSTVILRTVSEPGSRLATLLAGDLDLIEAVPAESAARLTADPHFHLVHGTSSRLVYLALDQHRSQTPFITAKTGQPLPRNPLLDLRVRQALDTAINRPAIVGRVMEGKRRRRQSIPPHRRPRHRTRPATDALRSREGQEPAGRSRVCRRLQPRAARPQQPLRQRRQDRAGGGADVHPHRHRHQSRADALDHLCRPQRRGRVQRLPG